MKLLTWIVFICSDNVDASLSETIPFDTEITVDPEPSEWMWQNNDGKFNIGSSAKMLNNGKLTTKLSIHYPQTCL